MGMNITPGTTPFLPQANSQQVPAQGQAVGQNGDHSIADKWSEVNKKVADNPVGSVVSGVVKGGKQDPLKTFGPIGAGLAGSWALGKGADYLLSSKESYERAPFMKLVKRIDNSWLGKKNSISDAFGRVFGAAKGVANSFNNFLLKGNAYKDASKCFKEGAAHKDWLSSFGASLLSHVDSNLADKFKISDLAKVLGEKGQLNKVHEFVAGAALANEAQKKTLGGAIAKHFKDKNLLEELSGKDKELIDNILKQGKDAKYSTLVDKFKLTPSLEKLQGNNLQKELIEASLNKNTKQAARDIANILHKKGGDLPKGFYKEPIPWIGKWVPFLDGSFKKTVDKINISANAQSGLSKALSKFSLGFSEFMGSNLFGVAVNGMFMGMAIKEASEAPKGEKVSTFMEGILGDWVGFMVVSPYISKLINGVAHLKNIDTGKASALMKIPAHLARGVGKIVGMGMDPNLGKKYEMLGKVGIKAPLTIAGGLIRLIALLVLASIASKPFKALSHLIFGKPTHKEEKEKKAKQEATAKKAQEKNPQQVLLNSQAGVPKVNNAQQAGLNQLLQDTNVQNEILSKLPGMDKAQVQEVMNNPQFKELLLADLSPSTLDALGNNQQVNTPQVQNAPVFPAPDVQPEEYKSAHDLAGEILSEYNKQLSKPLVKLNQQSKISKQWDEAVLF